MTMANLNVYSNDYKKVKTDLKYDELQIFWNKA